MEGLSHRRRRGRRAAHERVHRGPRARDAGAVFLGAQALQDAPAGRALAVQEETGFQEMKIRFTKMHGQGNDFVVIDAVRQAVELTPERARAIADRHFGVGCDQILVVEKARTADTDFRYRIYNADGGEVEQCGNGSRCFVRFVLDEGLTTKREIRVETASGVISPKLDDSGQVTVDMGAPRFEPRDVPFDAPRGEAKLVYPLIVGGDTVEVSVLSMGNPHAVQIVEDVERAPVTTQGPLIEHHPAFPKRVNAGYMQPVSRR